jgi:hypothetical protein
LRRGDATDGAADPDVLAIVAIADRDAADRDLDEPALPVVLESVGIDAGAVAVVVIGIAVRLRAADGGELVGVVVGVGDMSTVDIRHIDEPVQVVIEIGLRTICDRATGDGDRVAIAVGVQVIDIPLEQGRAAGTLLDGEASGRVVLVGGADPVGLRLARQATIVIIGCSEVVPVPIRRGGAATGIVVA